MLSLHSLWQVTIQSNLLVASKVMGYIAKRINRHLSLFVWIFLVQLCLDILNEICHG